MHQTLCHSLVLRNEETFVIECETWQVNVVMATVNLDYVALSSALPACVCLCVHAVADLERRVQSEKIWIATPNSGHVGSPN